MARRTTIAELLTISLKIHIVCVVILLTITRLYFTVRREASVLVFIMIGVSVRGTSINIMFVANAVVARMSAAAADGEKARTAR